MVPGLAIPRSDAAAMRMLLSPAWNITRGQHVHEAWAASEERPDAALEERHEHKHKQGDNGNDVDDEEEEEEEDEDDDEDDDEEEDEEEEEEEEDEEEDQNGTDSTEKQQLPFVGSGPSSCSSALPVQRRSVAEQKQKIPTQNRQVTSISPPPRPYAAPKGHHVEVPMMDSSMEAGSAARRLASEITTDLRLFCKQLGIHNLHQNRMQSHQAWEEQKKTIDSRNGIRPNASILGVKQTCARDQVRRPRGAGQPVGGKQIVQEASARKLSNQHSSNVTRRVQRLSPEGGVHGRSKGQKRPSSAKVVARRVQSRDGQRNVSSKLRPRSATSVEVSARIARQKEVDMHNQAGSSPVAQSTLPNQSICKEDIRIRNQSVQEVLEPNLWQKPKLAQKMRTLAQARVHEIRHTAQSLPHQMNQKSRALEKQHTSPAGQDEEVHIAGKLQEQEQQQQRPQAQQEQQQRISDFAISMQGTVQLAGAAWQPLQGRNQDQFSCLNQNRSPLTTLNAVLCIQSAYRAYLVRKALGTAQQTYGEEERHVCQWKSSPELVQQETSPLTPVRLLQLAPENEVDQVQDPTRTSDQSTTPIEDNYEHGLIALGEAAGDELCKGMDFEYLPVRLPTSTDLVYPHTSFQSRLSVHSSRGLQDTQTQLSHHTPEFSITNLLKSTATRRTQEKLQVNSFDPPIFQARRQIAASKSGSYDIPVFEALRQRGAPRQSRGDSRDLSPAVVEPARGEVDLEELTVQRSTEDLDNCRDAAVGGNYLFSLSSSERRHNLAGSGGLQAPASSQLSDSDPCLAAPTVLPAAIMPSSARRSSLEDDDAEEAPASPRSCELDPSSAAHTVLPAANMPSSARSSGQEDGDADEAAASSRPWALNPCSAAHTVLPTANMPSSGWRSGLDHADAVSGELEYRREDDDICQEPGERRGTDSPVRRAPAELEAELYEHLGLSTARSGRSLHEGERESASATAVTPDQGVACGTRYSPAELENQLYEKLALLSSIEDETAVADGIATMQFTVQQQREAMARLQQQERESTEHSIAVQQAYFQGMLQHMEAQHAVHLRELELGIIASREQLDADRYAMEEQLASRERMRAEAERAESQRLEREEARLDREQARLAAEQLEQERAERERMDQEWERLEKERQERLQERVNRDDERAEVQRERERLLDERERLLQETQRLDQERLEKARLELAEREKQLEQQHADRLQQLEANREEARVDREGLERVRLACEHLDQELQKRDNEQKEEFLDLRRQVTARARAKDDHSLISGQSVGDPISAADMEDQDSKLPMGRSSSKRSVGSSSRSHKDGAVTRSVGQGRRRQSTVSVDSSALLGSVAEQSEQFEPESSSYMSESGHDSAAKSGSIADEVVEDDASLHSSVPESDEIRDSLDSEVRSEIAGERHDDSHHASLRSMSESLHQDPAQHSRFSKSIDEEDVLEEEDFPEDVQSVQSQSQLSIQESEHQSKSMASEIGDEIDGVEDQISESRVSVPESAHPLELQSSISRGSIADEVESVHGSQPASVPESDHVSFPASVSAGSGSVAEDVDDDGDQMSRSGLSVPESDGVPHSENSERSVEDDISEADDLMDDVAEASIPESAQSEDIGEDASFQSVGEDVPQDGRQSYSQESVPESEVAASHGRSLSNVSVEDEIGEVHDPQRNSDASIPESDNQHQSFESLDNDEPVDELAEVSESHAEVQASAAYTEFSDNIVEDESRLSHSKSRSVGIANSSIAEDDSAESELHDAAADSVVSSFEHDSIGHGSRLSHSKSRSAGVLNSSIAEEEEDAAEVSESDDARDSSNRHSHSRAKSSGVSDSIVSEDEEEHPDSPKDAAIIAERSMASAEYSATFDDESMDVDSPSQSRSKVFKKDLLRRSSSIAEGSDEDDGESAIEKSRVSVEYSDVFDDDDDESPDSKHSRSTSKASLNKSPRLNASYMSSDSRSHSKESYDDSPLSKHSRGRSKASVKESPRLNSSYVSESPSYAKESHDDSPQSKHSRGRSKASLKESPRLNASYRSESRAYSNDSFGSETSDDQEEVLVPRDSGFKHETSHSLLADEEPDQKTGASAEELSPPDDADMQLLEQEAHRIMDSLQASKNASRISGKTQHLVQRKHAAQRLLAMKQQLIDLQVKMHTVEQEELNVNTLVQEAASLNVEEEVQRQLQNLAAAEPSMHVTQKVVDTAGVLEVGLSGASEDGSKYGSKQEQAVEEVHDEGLLALRAEVAAKQETVLRLRRETQLRQQDEEKRRLEADLKALDDEIANLHGAASSTAGVLPAAAASSSNGRGLGDVSSCIDDCAVESVGAIGGNPVDDSEVDLLRPAADPDLLVDEGAGSAGDLSPCPFLGADGTDPGTLDSNRDTFEVTELQVESAVGCELAPVCDELDDEEHPANISDEEDTVQKQQRHEDFVNQIADLILADLFEECAATISASHDVPDSDVQGKLPGVNRLSYADEITNSILSDLISEALLGLPLRSRESDFDLPAQAFAPSPDEPGVSEKISLRTSEILTVVPGELRVEGCAEQGVHDLPRADDLLASSPALLEEGASEAEAYCQEPPEVVDRLVDVVLTGLLDELTTEIQDLGQAEEFASKLSTPRNVGEC